MNPVTMLRELAEAYSEGLRVKQFGPGYKEKLEGQRIQNAQSSLNLEQDRESGPLDLRVRQAAAREAGLRESTDAKEAEMSGFEGSETGIASMRAMRAKQEADRKTAQENDRVANDQSIRERRRRQNEAEDKRIEVARLRAQIAADAGGQRTAESQSRMAVNRARLRKLEMEIDGTLPPRPRTPGDGARMSWSTAMAQARKGLTESGEEFDNDDVMEEAQELMNAANAFSPAGNTPPAVPGPVKPSAPKAPAGPKPGDRKTFPNGRTGEWDGKGWKLVN